MKNYLKATVNVFRLPVVVVKSIIRFEPHIISFFIHRQILKNLNFFKFNSKQQKQIANLVNEKAQKITGDNHDTYSGATDPEITKGFSYCIERMSKKTISYLEIGSANGKSMAYICSYARSLGVDISGVSVDPYFDEGYVEGGGQPLHLIAKKKSYLAPIGLSNRTNAMQLWSELQLNVDQQQDTSETGLLKLLKAGRTFDLIYIDGLHDGVTPLVDAALSHLLLSDGGIIMLDDRHWYCVHQIRNIFDQSAEYEKIHENWKISSYRKR